MSVGNQSIVLIYRGGAPKEECAWVTYGTPAKMLHKFMVDNGVDALLMTMDEYAELPERLVPRDQFGEARADAIFNEFVATKGGSLVKETNALTPEMQAAFEATKAALGPVPAFDIEDHRMTPEKKAFGDKRVAENVRFFYREEDKLAGYTDEQIADAYERWKDDNLDDANITTLAQRIDYRQLLETLYPAEGDPEPGEHQEVIDALKEC